MGDMTGIEKERQGEKYHIFLFGVMGTVELNGMKTDLLFLICQELFSSLRAHKVEPLAQHTDAIPVGQDRRKPLSSRIQRLNVRLNLVRVHGWRRALWRWRRRRKGQIDENWFWGVFRPGP
jgi:hypothetical protein